MKKFLFPLLILAAPAGVLVWSRTQDARARKLLEEIAAAERLTPHRGIRTMTFPGPKGTRSITGEIEYQDEQHRRFKRPEGEHEKPPARGPRGFPGMFRPGRGFHRAKFENPGLIVRNYRVDVTGQEEVAGRLGDVIEIRPRHAGRPRCRVVADRTSRFPLSYAIYNSEGNDVFQTVFNTIQFHPSFPEGTFSEEPSRRRSPDRWVHFKREATTVEGVSDRAGFKVFVPAGVPRGFELEGVDVVRVKAAPPSEAEGMVPKTDSTLVHVTYGDGLALFTIIEFRADEALWKYLQKLAPESTPAAARGVVARKFTHRAGVALQLELKGTVIVAAGNLSAEEIERSLETLVEK